MATYYIYNKSDFYNISTRLSDEHIICADIDFENDTISPMGTFTGKIRSGWNPITDPPPDPLPTYTLKNLNITSSHPYSLGDESLLKKGLFEIIDNGEISRVVFDNFKFISNDGLKLSCGIICGQLKSGGSLEDLFLKNCYIEVPNLGRFRRFPHQPIIYLDNQCGIVCGVGTGGYIQRIGVYNSEIKIKAPTGSANFGPPSGQYSSFGCINGLNHSTTISDCFVLYSHMNFEWEYNQKVQRAGGITGIIHNSNMNRCYTTITKFSNLYPVYALNDQKIGPSGINNCYWDSEYSGLTNPTGGDPKTTLEMQDIDTFTPQWSLSIWNIRPDILHKYPHHLWLYPIATINFDTLEAEDITFNSVKLRGEIDLGTFLEAEVKFEYREKVSGLWIDAGEQTVTSSGIIEHILTGLKENTEYEFRFNVKEDGSWNWKTIKEFKTLLYSAILITDINPVRKYFDADLEGEIDLWGEQDELSCFFKYRKQGESVWLESSSVIKTPADPDWTFKIKIIDLSPSTTYEYVATSENDLNEQFEGNIKTFTTAGAEHAILESAVIEDADNLEVLDVLINTRTGEKVRVAQIIDENTFIVERGYDGTSIEEFEPFDILIQQHSSIFGTIFEKDTLKFLGRNIYEYGDKDKVFSFETYTYGWDIDEYIKFFRRIYMTFLRLREAQVDVYVDDKFHQQINITDDKEINIVDTICKSFKGGLIGRTIKLVCRIRAEKFENFKLQFKFKRRYR